MTLVLRESYFTMFSSQASESSAGEDIDFFETFTCALCRKQLGLSYCVKKHLSSEFCSPCWNAVRANAWACGSQQEETELKQLNLHDQAAWRGNMMAWEGQRQSLEGACREEEGAHHYELRQELHTDTVPMALQAYNFWNRTSDA